MLSADTTVTLELFKVFASVIFFLLASWYWMNSPGYPLKHTLLADSVFLLEMLTPPDCQLYLSKECALVVSSGHQYKTEECR